MVMHLLKKPVSILKLRKGLFTSKVAVHSLSFLSKGVESSLLTAPINKASFSNISLFSSDSEQS